MRELLNPHAKPFNPENHNHQQQKGLNHLYGSCKLDQEPDCSKCSDKEMNQLGLCRLQGNCPLGSSCLTCLSIAEYTTLFKVDSSSWSIQQIDMAEAASRKLRLQSYPYFGCYCCFTLDNNTSLSLECCVGCENVPTLVRNDLMLQEMNLNTVVTIPSVIRPRENQNEIGIAQLKKRSPVFSNQFCHDCWILQQKLNQGSQEEKYKNSGVINEQVIDQPGTCIVQKILQDSNKDQRMKILQTLTTRPDGTAITHLPDGMEELVKLRSLDLPDTTRLQLQYIGKGVLSSFQNLEELQLEGSKLFKVVSPLVTNCLTEISLNKHGAQAMKEVINHLTEEKSGSVSVLQPYVLDLRKDFHGYQILLHYLQQLPYEENAFIFDAAIKFLAQELFWSQMGGTTGGILILDGFIIVIIDSRITYYQPPSNSLNGQPYVIFDIYKKYRVYFEKVIVLALGEMDVWGEILDFFDGESAKGNELGLEDYKNMLEGFVSVRNGGCDIILGGYKREGGTPEVRVYNYTNNGGVISTIPSNHSKGILFCGSGGKYGLESLNKKTRRPLIEKLKCGLAKAMLLDPQTGGFMTMIELKKEVSSKPIIKRYSSISQIIQYYGDMGMETKLFLVYDFKDKSLQVQYFARWFRSVVSRTKEPLHLGSPIGKVGNTGLVLRCLDVSQPQLVKRLLESIKDNPERNFEGDVRMKMVIFKEKTFYVCSSGVDVLTKLRRSMRILDEFKLAKQEGGLPVSGAEDDDEDENEGEYESNALYVVNEPDVSVDDNEEADDVERYLPKLKNDFFLFQSGEGLNLL